MQKPIKSCLIIGKDVSITQEVLSNLGALPETGGTDQCIYIFFLWFHIQEIVATPSVVTLLSYVFFCVRISSFPRTVCWKDRPFLTEWFWHPCQKSFDHVCEGLFLISSLFFRLFEALLFYSLSFVAAFKIRKYKSYSFVLSQDCFGPWDSVWILVFSWSIFAQKMSLGFL